MPPLPYVPARDPRHRIAVLALYRALVRSVRAIPLPPDVVDGGSVTGLVRRRFVKHKHFTSLRLLYAAMAAGYRFLTMFAKAQTPASAEHGQLVAFLRSHPARQPASSRSARTSESESASRVPAEPLIKNIAGPYEPPRYVSSRMPRPQSSLNGPRRVPILAMTCHGQPFLRLQKPQPVAMSRAIGRKEAIFKKKLSNVVHITDEILPSAECEDEWDRQVAQLMVRELGQNPDQDESLYTSFRWSAILGKLWMEWQLEKTWQDWIARGTALHELVEQERALAEQESATPRPDDDLDRRQLHQTSSDDCQPQEAPLKGSSDHHRHHEAVLSTDDFSRLFNGQPRPEAAHYRRFNADRSRETPNVGEYILPPSRLLTPISPPGYAVDPFVGQAWAALIAAEKPRLTRALLNGSANQYLPSSFPS
ncbi:hypothetical protein XA68_17556 [Ophiocordyceps unilateralis]|uniref:Uncharacterized protein n=1 Tax=Ophiocordyceps unilateralis TaxID=268505 RepID=A0A2A9P321_OPHUN|nr:hypothetical protein XA68_17556 [Ophiocordyceps unilateralis]